MHFLSLTHTQTHFWPTLWKTLRFYASYIQIYDVKMGNPGPNALIPFRLMRVSRWGLVLIYKTLHSNFSSPFNPNLHLLLNPRFILSPTHLSAIPWSPTFVFFPFLPPKSIIYFFSISSLGHSELSSHWHSVLLFPQKPYTYLHPKSFHNKFTNLCQSKCGLIMVSTIAWVALAGSVCIS